ncbi:MAG: nitrile hydratase accessory protein [Pseudomonadota bacterium]
MSQHDDASAVVFHEPWHATVLALVTALQERGVIGLDEWSQALGAAGERARAAGDPDDGSTYYNHVLEALEQLLAVRGIAAIEELRKCRDVWARAYAQTPHGQPVQPDRFR